MCVCGWVGGGGCAWVAFSVMVLFVFALFVCMFLGEVLFHVINVIMWQRCTCAMQCMSLSHTYTPLCTTVLTNTFMYSTGNTVDMLHW